MTPQWFTNKVDYTSDAGVTIQVYYIYKGGYILLDALYQCSQDGNINSFVVKWSVRSLHAPLYTQKPIS